MVLVRGTENASALVQATLITQKPLFNPQWPSTHIQIDLDVPDSSASLLTSGQRGNHD